MSEEVSFSFQILTRQPSVNAEQSFSFVGILSSRRAVLDLATSKFDMALAVVENSLGQNLNEESVVRLYDVGRIRAEEEDADDAENDEENEDDGKCCYLSLPLSFMNFYNKTFMIKLVLYKFTI